MGYWFENPRLKALAPLALSTSIKGLSTIFDTPKIFIGFNVFPKGCVVGSQELLAAGDRSRNLKRAVNRKLGLTCEQD